nr:MAG TPA: hypothetical protein [Bacteriophage sp.]
MENLEEGCLMRDSSLARLQLKTVLYSLIQNYRD